MFNGTRDRTLRRDVTTRDIGMHGKPSANEYSGEAAPYDAQKCTTIFNTYGYTVVTIGRYPGTRGGSDEEGNENDHKNMIHGGHLEDFVNR